MREQLNFLHTIIFVNEKQYCLFSLNVSLNSNHTALTSMRLLFLHPKPSSIFSQCIASLWRFSSLVDYYFKFSFDMKAVLYIAKYDFIHGD